MDACLRTWNLRRQALIEIERIRSMDEVVPVRDGNEIHVRLVSEPDNLAAELFRKMRLKLPSRPKTIEKPVEDIGSD